MKKLYIIVLVLVMLLLVPSANAQKKEKPKKADKEQVKKDKDTTSTDKDQDECCNGVPKRDGKGPHGKGRKMKDTFIDKDGDGVNDNRCKGMGLSNCPNKKKCRKME